MSTGALNLENYACNGALENNMLGDSLQDLCN